MLLIIVHFGLTVSEEVGGTLNRHFGCQIHTLSFIAIDVPLTHPHDKMNSLRDLKPCGWLLIVFNWNISPVPTGSYFNSGIHDGNRGLWIKLITHSYHPATRRIFIGFIGAPPLVQDTLPRQIGRRALFCIFCHSPVFYQEENTKGTSKTARQNSCIRINSHRGRSSRSSLPCQWAMWEARERDDVVVIIRCKLGEHHKSTVNSGSAKVALNWGSPWQMDLLDGGMVASSPYHWRVHWSWATGEARFVVLVFVLFSSVRVVRG